MFQRILVANRGEIALRVIRACKELGVEVVAVYSQADRDAPYLALADRAICIGKAASADSYLNIPRIIAAAEVADVQAIHPGYGFLSENPHFAEICRSCNFEFIGPPHEAIRKMGLKTEAKAVAAAAKVPVRPRLRRPRRQRRRGAPAGADDRLPRADQGRGRRRRQGDAGLPRGEEPGRRRSSAARNEAEAAFKNASVYLEKFIDRPRHVEVQILADSHGNVVHCWDRDCSLQRRHQKLVEESPAPTLPLEGPHPARRGRRPARQGRRLRQRRHLRVPRRRREQLLLHRGQRPDPGRAPGHRDGHRHRPGQAADPDRRGRAAAVLAVRDPDPRPLVRVPDQLRGPRQRLPPLARQDHRACASRAARASAGTRTSRSATRSRPTTTRSSAS